MIHRTTPTDENGSVQTTIGLNWTSAVICLTRLLELNAVTIKIDLNRKQRKQHQQ